MTQFWALMGLAVLVAFNRGQETAPRTVESVNLKQYSGTWYEIARFPNRFQDQCTGNVTAEYSIRPDGRIEVINRCRTADGSVDEARGIARRAGKDRSNAKLEVRFAPAFLSFLPMVWGDYWILGLGPGYSYSVVGDPNREYLWILSRTPTMTDAAYRSALEIAQVNGFDVSRLVRTDQGSTGSSGSTGSAGSRFHRFLGCRGPGVPHVPVASDMVPAGGV